MHTVLHVKNPLAIPSLPIPLPCLMVLREHHTAHACDSAIWCWRAMSQGIWECNAHISQYWGTTSTIMLMLMMMPWNRHVFTSLWRLDKLVPTSTYYKCVRAFPATISFSVSTSAYCHHPGYSQYTMV